MAREKIFGTEQEYGIVVDESFPRSGLFRGTSASDLVVAHARKFRGLVASRPLPDQDVVETVSDEEEEYMHALVNDILEGRRFFYEFERNPELLKRLSRAVFRQRGFSGSFLSNGARIYVDADHPEYSTPECRTIRSLLCAERAGEMIVASAATSVSEKIGSAITLLKNNCDDFGHSWATHENYLLARDTFAAITADAMSVSESGMVKSLRPALPEGLIFETYLVTRQLLCGAGRLAPDGRFLLSQRAPFFFKRIGYGTMGTRRPIVNTRDHPYLMRNDLSRLHVIAGDANRCDGANFIKIGLTSVILKMLEDGFFHEEGFAFSQGLQDPLQAIRMIAYDSTLSVQIPLADQRSASALEIQMEFVNCAERYCARRPVSAEEQEAVALAHDVLVRLGRGEQADLVGTIDWITKFHLLKRFASRHHLSWDDQALRAFELQYHYIGQDSLVARLRNNGLIVSYVHEENIQKAFEEPPQDTRARIRGALIKYCGHEISYMNWDRIFFDRFNVVVALDDPYGSNAEEIDQFFAAAHGEFQLFELLKLLKSKGMLADTRKIR